MENKSEETIIINALMDRNLPKSLLENISIF
jgi:hypothetical protein